MTYAISFAIRLLDHHVGNRAYHIKTIQLSVTYCKSGLCVLQVGGPMGVPRNHSGWSAMRGSPGLRPALNGYSDSHCATRTFRAEPAA